MIATSRRLLIAALLLTGGILAAKDNENPPKPLGPVEARKKVGEEMIVEMKVEAAKDRLEKRGEVYLDADLDFRSDKNFAVVINREGAAGFQAQGVKDFEEHFRGKTIRAKGVVTVVDDVPRIEVSDPKQVELVTQK